MRKIARLNLEITTYCNRNCPGCCAGTNMPSVGKHTDSEWIRYISKHFQNLERLTIAGGEPLVHPEFKFITMRIKKWFKPKVLELITNGTSKLLLQHWDTFVYYDRIRITNYTPDTYVGSKDNTDVLKEFIPKLKQKGIIVIIEKPIFRIKIGNGGMCGMGTNELVAIQDRKLYPCSASPGVKPDVGIEITKNWLSEIRLVKIPCTKCVFST